MGSDNSRLPIYLSDVNKELDSVSLSTTATTVWTPASGKYARALRLTISVDSAVAIKIIDSSGGELWRSGTLSADHSYTFDFGHGLYDGEADGDMEIATVSGTATAQGTLSGVEL